MSVTLVSGISITLTCRSGTLPPTLPPGFNSWIFIQARGTNGTNIIVKNLTYNNFGLRVYMVKPFSSTTCPYQYYIDFSQYFRNRTLWAYVKLNDSRTNITCDSVDFDNIHCFGKGEVGIYNLSSGKWTKALIPKLEVRLDGTANRANITAGPVIISRNIIVTSLDYQKD